jgi:hypothetical protein
MTKAGGLDGVAGDEVRRRIGVLLSKLWGSLKNPPDHGSIGAVAKW